MTVEFNEADVSISYFVAGRKYFSSAVHRPTGVVVDRGHFNGNPTRDEILAAIRHQLSQPAPVPSPADYLPVEADGK